jgi:predicted transcriptional regulator
VRVSHELSDDSRRSQVLEFIKEHPGTHLREIKRRLNLAMGVTQYHLYALEKEQKIISQRRGLYKRFYLSSVFGVKQQEILNVLSQETERDLLLYLIQNPLTTQTELSEYAQISRRSINWHMNRLREAGLVEAKREGPFVKYVVKGDDAEVLQLVRSFHPRVWEKWAYRLADVLAIVAGGD